MTNRSVPQLSHGRLLFSGYRASYPGVKRPGLDVELSPALVLSLRMSEATPLQPLPLWRGEEQLHIYPSLHFSFVTVANERADHDQAVRVLCRVTLQ